VSHAYQVKKIRQENRVFVIDFVDGCAARGSKPLANKKLETSKEVEIRLSNPFRGLPISG
jgi:hypothetical protein